MATSLALHAAERGIDLLRHGGLARVIDRDHGLDQPGRGARVLRRLAQGQRVLGKAGTAEAGTGVQEFVADAAVQADAARHVLDVGADLFAEARHLVDEGDLGRQECVGRVFDQLGAFAAGENDRRFVQVERAIDLAHDLAGALGIAADHHAVGAAEVVDRRTFAEELGVRGHVELRIRADARDDLFDLAAGADRHGRFGDDDGVALQRRGDLFGGGIDIGQVGMAVAAAAGRADSDEDRVDAAHGGGDVGLEGQAAGADVSRDDLVQARLEDRNLAGAQGCDFFLLLVDADDVVSELRQAGTRDKADIARADHRDAHCLTLC